MSVKHHNNLDTLYGKLSEIKKQKFEWGAKGILYSNGMNLS